MLVSINKQRWVLVLIIMGFSATGSAQTWTLKQCIDTALVHNRNLQISKNQTEISRQKYMEARSAMLPKLNAIADYKYFIELPYQLMPMSVFGGQDGKFKEAQFGVPHNINANVQLNYPIYNPQLRGASATAEIALELSDLNHIKTEEQVYFEISNLYYNAQIIRNQLKFIEGNLENSKKLLTNMQLLKQQKLAIGTDVDKATLQLKQLTTLKAQFQSQYNQVIRVLKFTMGVSPESAVDVIPEIRVDDEEVHSGNLVPEIEMAKTKSRLLLSELKSLKGLYKPTVSVYGSLGTTGLGYDKKPDAFLKFYPGGFAGVQVMVPLFNGTITKKRIQQKILELENNELQVDLVTEQNQMQVVNAQNQKMVTRITIENTLSQVQLAQDIYENSLLQQKQGLASLTDVLLADNALQDAQQKHLSSIVDYLKAELELKKLTGNLLNF